MPVPYCRPMVFCLLLSVLYPSVPWAESVSVSVAGDTVITVRRGEFLYDLAQRFLPHSSLYSGDALIEQIRRRNGLDDDRLQPGQRLLIPLGALEETEDADSGVTGGDFAGQTAARGKIHTFQARGVYLNARTMGSDGLEATLDHLVRAGGNAVVFDIKDRDGRLSYPSEVPLARKVGATKRSRVKEPKRFIELLHAKGLHAVARLTCFYDELLAEARPDLAPRSRREGGPWRHKGQLAWLDPASAPVQDYLLALIKEAAALGVDEVQLDYVRFPTEGDVADAVFSFDSEQVPPYRLIADFVGRARQILAPEGILLSADVFGVVAWGGDADIAATGQKMEALLPHLDIISPMLYPSHFYGPFGRADKPVDYPYYLVYLGCRRMSQVAAEYGVQVRPWIQAFSYRVEDFGPGYVTEQLHGAEDGGADGWLMWSTKNRYGVGLKAMERFVYEGAEADSSVVGRRFPPRADGGKAVAGKLELARKP
jgi:hypothetical protein